MPNSSKKHTPEVLNFITSALQHASFFMACHSLILAAPHILSAESSIKDKSKELSTVLAILRRNWGKFTSDIKPHEYSRLCDEIWLCRIVEAFETYLTRLLLMIFIERPESLRSSDTIKVRDALECKTVQELITLIAERKVHSLGYAGLDGIMSYLIDSLGLKFDKATPEYACVAEGMEVRNIIVHNAGKVSRIFLNRTGRTDLKVGTVFDFDHYYVAKVSNSLRVVSLELDGTAVRHFRLMEAST